ncbi:MAG: HPr(Ser) kinase/phosphatase [Clostridia bacterium]|nr:HPr(Ser) kinase/phosphatase [Clostridia bacterium]
MIKTETSNINAQEVSVEDFARALGLEIIYEGRGKIFLQSISVSRPGLQLSGYFKHFDHTRVQVIGRAEHEYLLSSGGVAMKNLEELFSKDIPCLIISRKLEVLPEIIAFATKAGCPIFRSEKVTTVLINEVTIYQNELLAPSEVVHGVLLDVFGIGILIKGKSGIGKSEIALELVSRGHRLVADDLVVLKNINEQIVGKAPDKIRYYMEIRGLGIINVQQMFGPGAIRPEKSVDIIAELSPWADGNSYERIGNEETYENVLGIDKQKIFVPVTPGRNIPIVIETAARKFRLKQAGFDASYDLMNTVFGEDKK